MSRSFTWTRVASLVAAVLCAAPASAADRDAAAPAGEPQAATIELAQANPNETPQQRQRRLQAQQQRKQQQQQPRKAQQQPPRKAAPIKAGQATQRQQQQQQRAQQARQKAQQARQNKATPQRAAQPKQPRGQQALRNQVQQRKAKPATAATPDPKKATTQERIQQRRQAIQQRNQQQINQPAGAAVRKAAPGGPGGPNAATGQTARERLIERRNAIQQRRNAQQNQQARAAKPVPVKRRVAQQRQQTRVNQQRYKQLQTQRARLQNRLARSRVRTATLAQQNQRLTRQRNWLARQNLAQRRYTYANFAFRNNARIFGRRRDRTVFAAFAIGAAVGAAVAGSYYVYYNDDPRLDWRSRDYYVDELGNGWTRSVVDRADGTRVVTIRDANGFIVRRYRVYDGDRYTLLYDNRPRWWDDQDLYVDVAPVRYSGPPERYVVEPSRAEPDDVYRAMTADPVAEIDRTYTLNQILMNANLRNYMPRVDLDSINFASGSAEIPEGELEKLEVVGAAMEQAIKDDKDEIYLIEGHTDRVGDEVDNMALSDERAAAVAKALTEYFDIPPENLVTQGYGEEFPKVDTDAAERRNRRVALRRITPLLDRSSNDLALDENGNEIIEDEAGQ